MERLILTSISSLLVIYNIGMLFPDFKSIRYVPLIFLAFLFLLILLDNKLSIKIDRRIYSNRVINGVMLLLLFSVLRSAHPEQGIITKGSVLIFWIFIYLFSYLSIDYFVKRKKIERLIKAVLLAPCIFVVFNLVAYLIGFENSENIYTNFQYSKTASLVGIDVKRVLFPLAKGINNFGVIAGTAFFISLIKPLYGENSRSEAIIYRIMSVLILITLMLTDSRSSLILPILLTLLIIALVNIRRIDLLKFIVFLLPVLPLILLLMLSLFAQTEIAETISRRPGDIESATGRNVFWGFSILNMLSPNIEHFIGAGQYGHIAQGVSEQWAGLWAGYAIDGTLMSTHNLALQLVFDIGYIGVLIFMLGFFYAIKNLENIDRLSKGSNNIVVAGLLVYYILIGTTESSISLYFPENLIMIYFLLMYTIILRSDNSHKYVLKRI